MCRGSSWATGAHMTELSAYGARLHVAGSLRMSWGGHSTEGADILGTLRADVIGGPVLEAPHHGGCGRGGVGDVDGVGTRTGSHNHFQSSRESSMSSAHAGSSSLVNSTPTSLSRCCVSSVTLSSLVDGAGAARGKWEGLSGQLGKGVDCSVSGGQRVGRGRGPGWVGGPWFLASNGGSMDFFLLNCSLHWVIRAVVGLSLSLRQREDNGLENQGEVVSRECA